MLAFEPALERQDRPQPAGIELPAQLFVPRLANFLRVKESLVAQAALVEQGFRPVAERPAQPIVERDSEAHLRPFDQATRDVPVKDFAEQPLGDPTSDLEAEWQ